MRHIQFLNGSIIAGRQPRLGDPERALWPNLLRRGVGSVIGAGTLRQLGVALLSPFPLLCATAMAQGPAAASPVTAPLKAEEVRRFTAPEARQGVAVDTRHFYAIANSRIGKYDKRSGRKLGEWVGDGVRIAHLNSCIVERTELICANSNYPRVPMASSVEIFDPRTMTHLRSVPLGSAYGSLTWVERHKGQWWAGFANYDGKGGEPGRDHRFTQIVSFDDQWRRTGGYALPATVLQRLAPSSNSGGSWGDDGLLYLTGHDAQEIYTLRQPGQGPVLEHITTITAPLDGQAWAWDRAMRRVLYGITRRKGEVIVMRVPDVSLPPQP